MYYLTCLLVPHTLRHSLKEFITFHCDTKCRRIYYKKNASWMVKCCYVCVSDYVVNRELSKTKWTGTRVHKYLYTHLCTVNKVLRFLSNGNTILL